MSWRSSPTVPVPIRVPDWAARLWPLDSDGSPAEDHGASRTSDAHGGAVVDRHSHAPIATPGLDTDGAQGAESHRAGGVLKPTDRRCIVRGAALHPAGPPSAGCAPHCHRPSFGTGRGMPCRAQPGAVVAAGVGAADQAPCAVRRCADRSPDLYLHRRRAGHEHERSCAGTVPPWPVRGTDLSAVPRADRHRPALSGLRRHGSPDPDPLAEAVAR